MVEKRHLSPGGQIIGIQSLLVSDESWKSSGNFSNRDFSCFSFTAEAVRTIDCVIPFFGFVFYLSRLNNSHYYMQKGLLLFFSPDVKAKPCFSLLGRNCAFLWRKS